MRRKFTSDLTQVGGGISCAPVWGIRDGLQWRADFARGRHTGSCYIAADTHLNNQKPVTTSAGPLYSRGIKTVHNTRICTPAKTRWRTTTCDGLEFTYTYKANDLPVIRRKRRLISRWGSVAPRLRVAFAWQRYQWLRDETCSSWGPGLDFDTIPACVPVESPAMDPYHGYITGVSS